MYGTHAGATAYFTARNISGYPSDQTEGEALLLRASESIDATFTPKGYVTDANQTASWPRHGVVDCEGRAVASDSVPAAIESATYELALLFQTNSAALAGTVSAGEFKKVKAGSVEVEYKDDDIAPVSVRSLSYSPLVTSFLRCYVRRSVGRAMIGLRKS